jgi:predicted transcriptional regulator of viral defense system
MKSRMDWRIIKHFSRKNVRGFSLQDVMSEFPGINRVYLNRVLAEMVDQGMLGKIARNLYHIIPLNADPDTYVPNRYQVAKYIMQNEEYYIGYSSALHILGITTPSGPASSENEVKVVTRKQIRPAIRQVGGTTCHFIRHDASYFFGFEPIWINHFEQAMISDLERTIVDLATKPRYGGGILTLGNAIVHAKGRIEYDKLFSYLARNGNSAAAKRFLFLADLLDLGWTNDHDIMMKEFRSGISLLDPSEPDIGKIQSKFGLKINVEPTLIKKEIHQWF